MEMDGCLEIEHLLLQCRLAFGNRPTVLRQLSCLPFRYFVEPKYMDILFPTLIACSFDCETTRAILETEMSLDLIVNYIHVSSCVRRSLRSTPLRIDETNRSDINDQRRRR